MEVIFEKEKPRPTYVPAETASLETEAAKKAREDKEKSENLTEAQLEEIRKNALKVMGGEPMTPEEQEAEAKKKRLATQTRVEEPKEAEPEDETEKKAEEAKAKEAEAKAKQEKEAAEAEAARKAKAEARARAAREKAEAEANVVAEAVKSGVKEAVQAIEAAKKPKEVAKEDEAEKELSLADREDLALIRRIEAADPKRNGLADDFISYTKRVAAYRAKFEAENPGEEFKPEDNRHDAFYAANEPKVTAAELEREREEQRIDAIVNKRVEAATKPLLEKVAKVDEVEKRTEMGRRLQELAPAAIKAKQESVLSMVQTVDAEAAKLLTDDKGNFVPSADNLKKLEEYDPWLKSEIDAAGRTVTRAVEEIQKWSDPEMQRLGYRFDPANNQVHRHIAEVALDAERTLAAGPAEARIRDGREFVTAQQYNARLAEAGGDARKVAAVSARFWTFGPRDLEYLVAGYAAGQIQAKATELEKFASSRAKRATKTEQATPPSQPPPSAPPPRERRKAPNTASATDVVADPAAARDSSKSFGERALEVAFK